MVTIGGKTKKAHAPIQPQYVVQAAENVNEYLLIGNDDKGHVVLSWIGDPNSATKFDSKYQAKHRTREMADVPETRTFRQLELKRK